jgi:hypothetical protein
LSIYGKLAGNHFGVVKLPVTITEALQKGKKGRLLPSLFQVTFAKFPNNIKNPWKHYEIQNHKDLIQGVKLKVLTKIHLSKK